MRSDGIDGKESEADWTASGLPFSESERAEKMRQKGVADMRRDYFECLHERNGICRRWLAPCRSDCRWMHSCGECRWYYIPAAQMPCLNCKYLDPDLTTGPDPEKGERSMDGEVAAEFRRVDDENKRQNHRLEKLEEAVEKANEIAVSVKSLAINMNNMVTEMTKQGERLEKLEQKPINDAEAARRTIQNTLVSALVGGGIAIVGALIVFAVKNLM